MPASRWSLPPAEPPPQATLPGLALTWATSSFIDCSFDAAGTTTTWYSPVRRAIGVTCDRLTGDLLVISAPTITMPPIIIVLPSPLLEVMNCARPMVPPAPPLLSTVTRGTILSACSAACSARPVWSQPPPGAAGTRIFRLSSAIAQGVASSKAPLAMAVARKRRA